MSLTIVFVRFDDSEYTMSVLFTAFNKEPFLTSKNRQPLSFEQAAGQITIIIDVKHVPYSVVLPCTDTYVRTNLYCTFS